MIQTIVYNKKVFGDSDGLNKPSFMHRYGTDLKLNVNCGCLLQRFNLAMTILVLLAVPSALVAATNTWSGAVSANWGDTGNWTGGNATPQSGDKLVFSSAGSTGTALTNNTTAGNTYILTFASTAPVYTITGNAIDVAGGVFINNDSTTSFQTIGFNIVLNGSGNLVNDLGGGTLLSGVISGAHSFNIEGGGPVYLAGANTMNNTGSLISAGTLYCTNAGFFSDEGLAIAAGAFFNYSSSATNIFYTTITGAGSVIMNGPGTEVLGGVNTYSGTTTINGGILCISAASTGTGAMTNNDGGNLIVIASGTSQLKPSTLALGSVNGATLGFSNVTSTTTAPLKPGTLTLNGTNTINILSGTLAAGSSYPLITYTTLAGSGSYVLGTLPAGFSGNLSTVGSTIYLNTTPPPQDIWTANVNTNWDYITANWTNSMPTNVFASGNSVTFNDTASAFTVNLATNVTPGGMTFSNSLHNYTINSAGGFTLGGSAVTLTGTSTTVTLNTANTFSGPITIGRSNEVLVIGGVGNLGNGTYAGFITNNGVFSYNSTVNQTLSGIISGSGSITDNSTNKLTLSAANSFTGSVVINSGIVSDLNNQNSTANPTVSGLGNPQTAGRTVTINNGATLSVDIVGAFGNGNTIEPLSFIINQGGTMQVTTGNSTIGPVTLNGGTLNAYAGSGYSGYFGPFELGGDVTVGGTSPSTISSGAQYNFNLVVDNAIVNRTINVADVTGDANVDLFVSAGLGDSSGNGGPGVANAAGLIKAGSGTMLLAGASLYSAGTTISAGTLIAGIADNLTAPASQGPGGTPTGGSTANPGGANSAGALGKPGSFVTLGDTNTTVNGSSPTLLIGGAFNVNHPIIVSTNVTTGTYIIGGSTDNNSYFSNLVTLKQPLTISQVANAGVDALSFEGGITSSNGLQTVTFAGPGNVAVANTGMSDGSGTLAVKVSGGALYLNATNTYSGGTTVTNGGILGGRGMVSGAVTNQLGGILAPGAATNLAGTVLVISNLTLLSGSFTTMSVSHNGHTNDQIVSSNIVYGGTLTVTTNAGDAPFVYGDTFTLFKSGAYSGNFSVINLPALGSSLVWGNTLSSDGKLTVVSATSGPATMTNLPASNVQTTAATLNGQVVSVGSQIPTVTLYYGPADGGTNVGAWSNSIVLGLESGSFSSVVTGLSSGTTYYYAVAATNSAGNSWAVPSQSFTTLAITPAVVTNLPATSVQATSATLNGQVISTGNQTPTVTLYYGTVDGGTNAGAWSNKVILGTQGASFSDMVTGLLYNTIYYYAVAATNSAGNSWATPSQAFTTPPIFPAVVTNLPATSVQIGSAVLNGQVVSAGNQTPVVTLYYGPVDGGTNAGAWSNSVVLGTQNGSFSYAAGGLLNNTTYYYTASATNLAGLAWAAPSQSFTTPVLLPVYTYHYDNTRQGANTNESILTPANVNTNSFGKLFSYTTDGAVYAQPLIATNVTIPGMGVHNVLYVVTENDTVYAFDADNYVPTPYWTNSFINPAAGINAVPGTTADPNGDVKPTFGITATPVIDPATGTIYVESRTAQTSGGITTYPHQLHALDIGTGLDKTSYNSPILITCTNYPGTGTPGQNDTNGPYVLWNGLRENCRPALLLANGMVYICYASPGDKPPWYGWVFSYDAHTLAQTGAFNTAPNIGDSGIWMTGNGPAADTNGNIYLNTGNGIFDANTGGSDYGDSILKLTNGPSGLKLSDYFTPFYQANLYNNDQDVTAAGLLLLPSVNGTNLLLSGSKFGPLYLLNTANMGHYNASSDNQIVQEVTNAVPKQWSSPAYFNGMIYTIACANQSGGSGDVIKQFSISGTIINTNPVAKGTSGYLFPGATPTISASGTSNGIVWAINSSAFGSSGQAVLHAYNATNVAQEFYNSSQLSRDNPGVAVKFTLPVVANGKVYVGAANAVSVFGLTAYVATPVISPNGGAFANSQVVTLSDATSGATNIYYTLDGSAPTTNSLLYTGPFAITSTLILQAVAVTSGGASSVASASFVNTAAAGNGAGLLGQYWTNTTGTAFTNVSFNTSPTLTRTDAVVNFNWTTNGPDPSIGRTNYTVRWTGAVQAQYNETYTFTTVADDGVRLWVNGQLLVNDWNTHTSAATNGGSITLNSQQLYNLRLEYFQNTSNSMAQLYWSSPSTASAIIPQTQLYPYTNPPPTVMLTAPTGSATNFTSSASVTISADADAPYNPVSYVSFYANSAFLGSVSNAPYTITATGLAAGTYALTAVAVDGSDLSSTSAPVNITVATGSGQPYGLTSNGTVSPFFNMPTTFNGFPAMFPTNLSQTGVFSNTPGMTPTNGLIPYIPNTPLWSDGAVKTRYLAVPNNGGVITPDEQIAFAPTGTWTFPAGTVFVKTFQLNTDTSNPNVLHRLETRLLVRDINGAVYGVTYKWRPDNSDADLLTASLNENILITNATGTSTQTWYYPSPADCLTCHTPVANYVLGVNSRQLNGNESYPATGVTDNQLRTLNRLGLFNPAFDESGITNFEALSSITNPAASFEQRARSYLDANCAQCHQPGSGVEAAFDARFDTPLSQQGITNAPALFPIGISDNACVVKAGDIWRSVLYLRMNTTNNAIKMPPLARNLIDTNAVQVFNDWINSLPGTPALAPPVITPNGGNFSASVGVTFTPPDTNAAIYYTLDGSLPTTNSFLYSGAFNLTSNVIVSANAFETNFNNSVAVSALFQVQPLYFTSEGFLPNQQFQLGFAGAAGSNYVLLATTNFLIWTPISTNTASSNLFNLVDPNATNFPYRFYRVIQQ